MAFSYAQAARGMATPSNMSSNPASSASSERGSKDAVKESSPAIAETNQSSRPSQQQETVKDDKEQTSSQHTAPSNGTENAAAMPKEMRVEVKNVEQDSKSRAEKDERSSTQVDIPKDSQTERSEPTSTAEDLVDRVREHKDNKDVKDTDSDWEKVSLPSTSADKEKELKPAPVPTVNFWTQRSQQLQQAKNKENVAPTAQRASTQMATPIRTRTQNTEGEDLRKKSASKDGAPVADSSGRPASNVRPSREPNINAQTKSPSGARDIGSRSQSLPVDTESWPTPESSMPDPSRRASVKDAGDRLEGVDAKSGGRQKWTPVPFVPTVKFETQMPGQARRGGKPATRGRGGASGAHGERISDHKHDSGSMAPPPLPKSVSEGDRGRKSAPTKPSRTASLPRDEAVVEAETEDSTTHDAKMAGPPHFSGAAAQRTGSDTPSTQDPSRSSSQQPPFISSPEFAADSFGMTDSTGSPTRYSQQGDRARGFGDAKTQGQAATPKTKTNENWRPNDRRGGAERGRGNYRGRGGMHSTFNGGYTAPLPQNGFETSKNGAIPGQELRSRQSSAQHPYGTFTPNRAGNLRTQSVPHGVMNSNVGGFYGGTGVGYPFAMPPIETNMAMDGYNRIPNGAPYSASASYNGPIVDYNLVNMVVAQLEYYFSIDNLCKDMYLRKHMDSQGFVPLKVIGGFRRIQTLLGDPGSYDTLRAMATGVRNIEFYVDENGIDRMRSREHWKDFVLPMEERLPQAQNDGPKVKNLLQSYSSGYGSGMMPADMYMNGMRSAPPGANAFETMFPAPKPGDEDPLPEDAAIWAARNEYRHDEARRTSVTSPLSKVQTPSQDGRPVFGMTNGHRDSVSSNPTTKENTFPDERVAALKVVVRDPEYQGNSDDAIPDEPLPARSSGMRGGEGSTDLLDRVRGLQFGGHTPALQGEQGKKDGTMYSIQTDSPPQHLVKPGYIWEEYPSLRDLALQQRAQNHFDGAAAPLYPLWTEFLAAPNQFNVGMYEDFKTWAIEDAEKGNFNGKNHLVKFYDTMLTASSALSPRLSQDIVDIARKEADQRPLWSKLRSAWRNGATNLKTIKRLSEVLTKEERALLDRGV